MLKFLYYSLLLIMLPSLTFSQTKGRVVYKETSKLNEINNSYRMKSGLAFINNRLELRASIPLNLDFDKRESVFYVDTETKIQRQR